MRKLRSWFGLVMLRGLSVVLPVAIAVYLILWLLRTAETLTLQAAVHLLPWDWYLPGSGILIFCGLLFAVGLLMYPWMSRQWDRFFRGVPLFGSIYGPVRDLMNVLGDQAGERRGSPVLVTLPGTEVQTLGFLTAREATILPPGKVLVYVQFASQIGGLTLIVPEDSCEPLEMSQEAAFRLALTAGLSSDAVVPVRSGKD